ncbi:MAG: VanZ family protein [Clostridium sp.]|nr:VanZ family protein [Clostridium sp.]
MKKLIILLAAVLWFGFIFYNSTKPGDVSNAKSYSILNKIRTEYRKLDGSEKQQYKALPQNAREEKLNLIIRKNAHAFEYCVLAIVVSAILFQFKLKGKGAIIYIMFICLFYAVLDEFHQIYVPGRTSSVRDVLIDFAGALIGMGAYYLIYYKFFNKKNNNTIF